MNNEPLRADRPLLRRSIGLPLLTLYGLGTILGAGIYVLIGEVAAEAGSAAPIAFVLAGIVAAMTALSFAELGSRIPRSAGEAAYVDVAFGRAWLTISVGAAVAVVGVVSAATMLRGFAGYLDIFVTLPHIVVVLALVAGLTVIAIWGIGESLSIAAAITLLEIGGLVFVCVTARDGIGQLPAVWPSIVGDATAGLGVVSGAFLAFYAFIGFEDIVNVAEEVREPERTLPRAILIALVLSTALYCLTALFAVLSVPPETLAGSGAPLAVVVESRGGSGNLIAGISLFAVTNGALVQIIMASRVLYGLAARGLVWRGFARIHSRTQTPVTATATIAVFIAALAALFPLGALARATSFVALAIFCAVNLALLVIKRREAATAFSVPAPVPAVGFVLSFGMIVFEGFGHA